jgi:hypothetical protein
MVKATVMSDVTTENPGEHKSKETSVTPGQTEVSLPLWAREGLKTGIWDQRNARQDVGRRQPSGIIRAHSNSNASWAGS